MPSFRELLAAHAPLLLLDAASANVQTGWFADAADARWASSLEEAGVALFRGLEQLGVDPGAAAAFVFCDGPGSILGCRTAAMVVRTWCVLLPRPVFAYHSLSLVAHALARPEVKVIADARRDTWHCAAPDQPLRRVPVSDLRGPLVMPEGFRHWAPLPPDVSQVPYTLADLLPHALDANLFRPAAEPDAFLHAEPTYATWTPQVHRAP